MIDFDAAEVEKRLAELAEKGRRAAAAGAFAGMTVLLERTLPLVPRRTGRLAGSAFVALPDGANEVAAGFSDPKAAAVHEISAHHTVGETKFLEKAVNAFAGEAFEAAARAIEVALAGGGDPTPVFPTSPPAITENS